MKPWATGGDEASTDAHPEPDETMESHKNEEGDH